MIIAKQTRRNRKTALPAPALYEIAADWTLVENTGQNIKTAPHGPGFLKWLKNAGETGEVHNKHVWNLYLEYCLYSELVPVFERHLKALMKSAQSVHFLKDIYDGADKPDRVCDRTKHVHYRVPSAGVHAVGSDPESLNTIQPDPELRHAA